MSSTSSSISNIKCALDSSVLLIVDIQTNLGQAMPGKVLNRVVSNTILLTQSAALLDLPVIVTEQYPKGLGDTLDTITEILPQSAQRFEKTTFSSTGAAGFMQSLEALKRRQVIIVGMEAHVCVLQSALDLIARDYVVYVVEDAVCSRRLENYQNALDRLRQVGVGVISAESAIFEWLVDSKHEQFRTISGLLR